MERTSFILTNNGEVINMISREIGLRLRDSSGNLDRKVVLAAYLLAKIKQNGHTTEEHFSYSDITSESLNTRDEIIYAIKSMISLDDWERLRPFLGAASASEFASVAAFYNISPSIRFDAEFTPFSIIKLAEGLLNVHAGDQVIDLCCGAGSFITYAGWNAPEAHYKGYDININNLVIAMIRADLLGIDVDYQIRNVFDLPESDQGKYDIVFTHPPLSGRIKGYDYIAKYVETKKSSFPGMEKMMTSDWAYAELACSLLRKNGKAAVLMAHGSFWNRSEASIRKDFLEKGLIETVILLPDRMIGTTGINTVLYIFSEGNASVSFVDARRICHKGRRFNEFTDSDVAYIKNVVSVNSKHGRLVSLEEIRGNDYSLNPSKYLDNGPSAISVRLEDVIKNISIGAHLNASQLDEIASSESTNYHYLRLSDVQDGIIEKDLPSITHIEPRWEKYCVKNDALLISKNGNPFKVTVAEVSPNQKILVNGNFYIIELDTTKVNPYFVLAYLNSEQGMEMLNRLSVGSVIPILSLETIKDIKIPAPPLEEQWQIASEYRRVMDEVAMTRYRLKKATDHLRHVYQDK